MIGSTQAVVTGVAGFIGSHLAESLLGRGVRVVGIDRRPVARDPVAARNVASLATHPEFRLVEADLAGLDLAPYLADASVVYHLAGLPGVRSSWGESFADYLTCNVLVTQRLLDACAAARVPRMVLASSSSVYGGAAGRPSREGDLPTPLSPYGVTKLAAERLALAHARRVDTPTSVVALRYFTVYGPRQRPDMAIGRVLRAARTGRPLHLYGDGLQRRDFTYVGDVVAATLAAATAPARDEVVNVGGGSNVSMLEVLDRAAEITGRDFPVRREARQPGDVEATLADLAKARDLLGYQPVISLADGMRLQWKWLLSREPDDEPAPGTLGATAG
ncbi:NAD-dependent epimerase/dehydratase family protein [Sphaerisporangium aureirubrum]|uniref:NAD-dependent epimerase/dehydratase family protein n=1 Tax=Sphaerisporangium aureirubrum TaxID=1544736 RepID=A0ABW1NVK0_9ACTN